jgi:hypothetical protein
MLYLCEDVGVASCSSHILCSYNLTLGSISSVYPDSVNGKDILLIVPSSSFRPVPSSFVTSFHSNMILANKVPTPSHNFLGWQHPALQRGLDGRRLQEDEREEHHRVQEEDHQDLRHLELDGPRDPGTVLDGLVHEVKGPDSGLGLEGGGPHEEQPEPPERVVRFIMDYTTTLPPV